MNKEMLEEHWTELKSTIKGKFPNLTDDDIRQIDGRYDQLLTRLQQRYGYSRESAEEELNRWVVDPNFKRFTDETQFSRPSGQYSAKSDMRKERKEDSSLFKWLLFAGIPFLLLLTFLANQNMRTREAVDTRPAIMRDADRSAILPAGGTRVAPSASSYNQTGITPSDRMMRPVIAADGSTVSSENAADRLVSQHVRQGLSSDVTTAPIASKVIILTSDGVVTISGVVSSQAESDRLAAKIHRMDGVRDVKNQLQVK